MLTRVIWPEARSQLLEILSGQPRGREASRWKFSYRDRHHLCDRRKPGTATKCRWSITAVKGRKPVQTQRNQRPQRARFESRPRSSFKWVVVRTARIVGLFYVELTARRREITYLKKKIGGLGFPTFRLGIRIIGQSGA